MSDAQNESSVIADMVSDDFYVARLVANLSAAYATDLCVWTQQALPSPPTGLQPDGSCAPSPCAWPPLPAVLPDVQSLAALGAQAIARMALMDAGAHSFLGSTCGVGSGNAAVLCAADPGSTYCAPGLLAMRQRWAVASNIVMVTPQTLDAVVANYSLWRGSAAWHLPAMSSAIVQRGWGFGGAISIKVLPFSARAGIEVHWLYITARSAALSRSRTTRTAKPSPTAATIWLELAVASNAATTRSG